MTCSDSSPGRACAVLAAMLLAGFLGGCAGAHEPAAKAPMPGSDRDAHGCIASAGYAWCAGTQRCERPWELARERGFDNSAEAFKRFCTAPAVDPPMAAAHE